MANFKSMSTVWCDEVSQSKQFVSWSQMADIGIFHLSLVLEA